MTSKSDSESGFEASGRKLYLAMAMDWCRVLPPTSRVGSCPRVTLGFLAAQTSSGERVSGDCDMMWSFTHLGGKAVCRPQRRPLHRRGPAWQSLHDRGCQSSWSSSWVGWGCYCFDGSQSTDRLSLFCREQWAPPQVSSYWCSLKQLQSSEKWFIEAF